MGPQVPTFFAPTWTGAIKAGGGRPQMRGAASARVKGWIWVDEEVKMKALKDKKTMMARWN